METLQQRIRRLFFMHTMVYKSIGVTIPQMIILTAIQFHTFPSDLEGFNTYLDAAMIYLSLTASSPRLISSGNKTALHLLYDTSTDPDHLDWKKLRLKLSDVTTDSPFYRHERAIRRHEIEQLMLDIFDDIPKSTWTNTDRTTLRRPGRSTERHASYVIDVAPDLTIAEILHKAIKVHLHNPETPETDEMPENQLVNLEWFIGAADTVLASIVPTHHKNVKRALYLIHLLTADVGKTLFVRATYVNTVGDESLIIGDWVEQVIG